MRGTVFQRSIPVQRGFTDLIARVREEFDVVPARPRRVERRWFDSFDWRLVAAGCALEHDGAPDRVLRLVAIGESGALIEEPCTQVPARPADLPDGPLRAALAAELEARALLPLGR